MKRDPAMTAAMERGDWSAYAEAAYEKGRREGLEAAAWTAPDGWGRTPHKWHRYPYAVRRYFGGPGWVVDWHYRSAGVSALIGRYDTEQDAVAAAEMHGEERGWLPCDPRAARLAAPHTPEARIAADREDET